MVEGLPVIKATTIICKGCVVGKHPEHKFDWGKESQASCILGMIHSDIRGPMPTTSMNGSRCFLTFIDDFSKYTWVFFLSKRSRKSWKKSLNWRPWLRMHLDKRSISWDMIMVGSMSNDLLHICSKSGIRTQHSVPYTPQQNDVAERKNRSLKEMTTCMLESKKLDANLWTEAMHHVVYI